MQRRRWALNQLWRAKANINIASIIIVIVEFIFIMLIACRLAEICSARWMQCGEWILKTKESWSLTLFYAMRRAEWLPFMAVAYFLRIAQTPPNGIRVEHFHIYHRSVALLIEIMSRHIGSWCVIRLFIIKTRNENHLCFVKNTSKNLSAVVERCWLDSFSIMLYWWADIYYSETLRVMSQCLFKNKNSISKNCKQNRIVSKNLSYSVKQSISCIKQWSLDL